MKEDKVLKEELVTAFCDNVSNEMRKKNKHKKWLATKTYISYHTLLQRFKSPESFTLGEMYDIAEALEVSLVSLLCRKVPVYEWSENDERQS